MKKYKILFIDLDTVLIKPIKGEDKPLGIWDMQFRWDNIDCIKWLASNGLSLIGIFSHQLEVPYLESRSGFQAKLEYVSLCLSQLCNYIAVDTKYTTLSANREQWKYSVREMFDFMCGKEGSIYRATNTDEILIVTDNVKQLHSNYVGYYKISDIMTVSEFRQYCYTNGCDKGSSFIEDIKQDKDFLERTDDGKEYTHNLREIVTKNREKLVERIYGGEIVTQTIDNFVNNVRQLYGIESAERVKELINGLLLTYKSTPYDELYDKIFIPGVF
jgi:hypothetical protein